MCVHANSRLSSQVKQRQKEQANWCKRLKGGSCHVINSATQVVCSLFAYLSRRPPHAGQLVASGARALSLFPSSTFDFTILATCKHLLLFQLLLLLLLLLLCGAHSLRRPLSKFQWYPISVWSIFHSLQTTILERVYKVLTVFFLFITSTKILQLFEQMRKNLLQKRISSFFLSFSLNMLWPYKSIPYT